MFRKDQFPFVFNTVFALFFSLALTAFTLFMQGRLTAAALIPAFISAFSVNFVLSSFIPANSIGSKFAALFTKNEKSLLFYLLRMFMIVLIMTVAMCFFMLFIEMGFSSAFIPAFLSSIPATFAFAYVVAVLCCPLLEKLTHRLCAKE